MTQLLVHASGFKNPFSDDSAELSCGPQNSCEWSPSTDDFQAMGESSGGSYPASTVAELAQIIDRQPIGSIQELRIIGHSNQEQFAVGGRILPQNVKFQSDSIIGRNSEFVSLIPRFQMLANRFAQNARITLLGCNSGGLPETGGRRLVDFVSCATLLPVHGYFHMIDYYRRSGHVNGALAVTPRGMARYASDGRPPEPPASRNLDDITKWEQENFRRNAWELHSDVVRTILPVKAIAKAKAISSPSGFMVGKSSHVLWHLMEIYFPSESSLVSGSTYFPATELSLATEGSCIMVSQGFINNLNEGTLH